MGSGVPQVGRREARYISKNTDRNRLNYSRWRLYGRDELSVRLLHVSGAAATALVLFTWLEELCRTSNFRAHQRRDESQREVGLSRPTLARARTFVGWLMECMPLAANRLKGYVDTNQLRALFSTQVNRCDLASAKLELKAMRQENNRLLSKARGQAGRIRELEVSLQPTVL